MDLEKVAAVIRPRGYWESVDLGFCMARAWRRPIFAAWIAAVVPTIVAICAIFPSHPAIAVTLIWWLKPLFDRIPLFVISRALFGVAPGWRETLRATPGLWRANTLTALTLHRLDPARAFHLPVWQLEGMRGRARVERLRVLDKGCYGEAGRLLAVCAAFESSLWIGVVLLAISMTPGVDPGAWFSALVEGGVPSIPLHVYWLAYLPWFLAMSAIEPFYVASGFALYLNRRARLEAWDVEIAFRRMARRLDPGADAKERAAASVTAVVAAIFLATTATVIAATIPSGSVTQLQNLTRPEKAIQEVLSEPEFQTAQRVTVWRLKNLSAASKQAPPPSPLLLALGPLIAAVIQPLLWIVLLVGLGLLLRTARQRPRLPRDEIAGRARPPDVVAGLDIRPESFPPDIPRAARALWEEGRAAEALSLLYRGALASLATRDRLPLRKSFTEGDCLSVVAKRSPEGRAIYFRSLTESWQSAAYGRRTPPPDRAERILAEWPRHFGGTP